MLAKLSVGRLSWMLTGWPLWSGYPPWHPILLSLGTLLTWMQYKSNIDLSCVKQYRREICEVGGKTFHPMDDLSCNSWTLWIYVNMCYKGFLLMPAYFNPKHLQDFQRGETSFGWRFEWGTAPLAFSFVIVLRPFSPASGHVNCCEQQFGFIPPSPPQVQTYRTVIH